jgi:hypothetical protein
MKIELDKGDIDYINKINASIEAGDKIPTFINEVGKEYYLRFEANDIAKASAFIMYFMHPNKSQEILDEFGIDIKSIDFAPGGNKIANLKNLLQDFIEKLDVLDQVL